MTEQPSNDSLEISDVTIEIEERDWPLVEPFTIARGTRQHTATLQVRLAHASGAFGRGEACGVTYEGETPTTMRAQLEAVRSHIEDRISRKDLLAVLPAGGTRCAVDGALWDLEAKLSGVPAFARAGLKRPSPVHTAYTIGIRDVGAYEAAATRRRDFRLLKVKVARQDPIAAIAAVRRGAPDSDIIVDPNQAWSVDELKEFAGALSALGRVVLLEQPIPVGCEAALDGLYLPIPLCADELVKSADDLDRARDRFQLINIKLDKAGGLTAALELAKAARRQGFDLMVGCMAGSSLSMAPAMVLAQQCRFVDLDGPLLQSHDWPNGLRFDGGLVHPPERAFWG